MGALKRRLLEHRLCVIVVSHAILAGLAFTAAFVVRFDFTWPLAAPYHALALRTLPAFVTSALASAFVFGLFSGMWRYVSMQDLTNIVKAVALTYLAFGIALWLWGPTTPAFPRSIGPLAAVFTLLGFGGIRFVIRRLREVFRPARSSDRLPSLLVVGAGDAGNLIARDLHENHDPRYRLVGFLDDDPHKQGLTIQGYRVLGTVADLSVVVAEHDIDQVLIAIPSAPGRRIRQIMDQCRDSLVAFKTLPGLSSLVDGKVSVSNIRDVSLDDLLRRAPVALDLPDIERLVTGRTVMVTGAGGSIGSELCRQICRFKPARLLLFERSEPSLYAIDQELRLDFPSQDLVPIAGDVTDPDQLDHVLRTHRPTLVLHAAAYKHVPLMELNVARAVRNNVLGTRTLAWACHRHDVGTFVLVSTDKAVNPTSVMGCTKRAAELVVQDLAGRSRTRYVTVRFGNVLGSVGSVVPLFQRQIARGGPVTVTHPDMRRYFMTIPEASQLILEAATLGRGGETFVLDMGEPVLIADLARDLIRLSGLTEGEDIDITYTGLRPGEKLFEEILTTGDTVVPTRHPGIVVARTAPPDPIPLVTALDTLSTLVTANDDLACRAVLADLVPEYEPDHTAHDRRISRDPDSACLPPLAPVDLVASGAYHVPARAADAALN